MNLTFNNSLENHFLSFEEITQSEAVLHNLDSNEISDYEWWSEMSEQQVLISVDEILVNQPGLLLRHERNLLDDVYEDDLFYPKNTKNQFFLNRHMYEA